MTMVTISPCPALERPGPRPQSFDPRLFQITAILLRRAHRYKAVVELASCLRPARCILLPAGLGPLIEICTGLADVGPEREFNARPDPVIFISVCLS